MPNEVIGKTYQLLLIHKSCSEINHKVFRQSSDLVNLVETRNEIKNIEKRVAYNISNKRVENNNELTTFFSLTIIKVRMMKIKINGYNVSNKVVQNNKRLFKK